MMSKVEGKHVNESNSVAGEVDKKEYGYRELWPGDAGGDPRKTSLDEFHSSTEEYSNDEVAKNTDRSEDWEDDAEEEVSKEATESSADEYHKVK